MKPERIQFAPSLPVLPTVDRGVYQTFEFESLSKAENFAAFTEDMADNHGLDVTCLVNSRHLRREVAGRDRAGRRGGPASHRTMGVPRQGRGDPFRLELPDPGELT